MPEPLECWRRSDWELLSHNSLRALFEVVIPGADGFMQEVRDILCVKQTKNENRLNRRAHQSSSQSSKTRSKHALVSLEEIYSLCTVFADGFITHW